MGTSTQDLIPAVEPEPTETGKSKKNLTRWIAGIATVAIAIGGYTYLNNSTPVVGPGGLTYGPQGAIELPDPSEPLSQFLDHAYLQTESDTWLLWSIRNDGKADLALTQPSCKPSDCANLPAFQPKVYFGDIKSSNGFAGFPYFDANGKLQMDGLDRHLLTTAMISPGDTVVMVAHYFFPKRCIVTLDQIHNGEAGGHSWMSSITMKAESLRRPSTIEVALPAPFIRPLGKEIVDGCSDESQKWLLSSAL
jgi:hypothetical protein